MEEVLVIKREKLFGNRNERYFEGFSQKTGNDDLMNAILKNYEFLPRKSVENNPSYKQIIPYIIFTYGGSAFAYLRLENSGEKRLHSKYSIGIGGHINKSDSGQDMLAKAVRREFFEEMDYSGEFKAKIIGFLNLDGTSVDKVHFGIVYLVRGTSGIKVREKSLLKGELKRVEAIKKLGNIEGWSGSILETEGIKKLLQI